MTARAVLMAMAIGSVSSTRSESQTNQVRFTFTEYHMGIDARIVLYSDSQQSAEAACAAAFQRMEELEQVMSDYRQDSELMRLCARAGQGPVPVSADLLKVLVRSQRIAKETGGAFDVTVGPLVQIWRRARKDGQLPAQSEVAQAMRLVGWQKLRLAPKAQTVELKVPGMRLDLGGIGKGMACDEALKVLRRRGIKSALVEMGGEIVLSAAPPGSKGWKISVPNADRRELELQNCSVSTSGDTELFIEFNGVRYSHVVDPKTGYGLMHRAQATVIAKDGITSDPVATAMTVMGEEMRRRYLCRYPRLKVFMKTAP